MSGGSIAYHLRENKAIERNLFLDLLAKVGRVWNISDYTYIGFGGPFLEDFKAVHSALRIEKMVSIEMDENVMKRQQFNFPAKYIRSENCRSSEFIESYDITEGPVIAWLDYTSPAELYDQLSEFRQLISKMDKFDVAKITINAHAPCLGVPGDAAIDSPLAGLTLHPYRAKVLERKLNDYCPGGINPDDVLPKSYPATLLRSIKNSLTGLSGRFGSIYFQPLSAFTYQDGQQMLTVTGVILDAEDDAAKKDFLEKSRIEHWPFKNLDWSRPSAISVPTLSAKERMVIDAALPVTSLPERTVASQLMDILGYVPGTSNDRRNGEVMLENYARFYRVYPLFSRVVL